MGLLPGAFKIFQALVRIGAYLNIPFGDRRKGGVTGFPLFIAKATTKALGWAIGCACAKADAFGFNLVLGVVLQAVIAEGIGAECIVSRKRLECLSC